MKVLIFTEGNRELGLGHIIRCISLYQAFEAENVEVTIIAQGAKEVKQLLAPFSHKMIDWVDNLDLIKKLIKGIDIVIVDSRQVKQEVCKEISQLAKVPVYFDDTFRLNYDKGIVVNRTIRQGSSEYPQKKGLVYLLGTKYMPLTKAFWYAPIKSIRRNIHTILISFGGSDPKNQTSIVTNYLKNSYPKYKFNVIVGGACDRSSLKIRNSKQVKIHTNLSGEQMKNQMLDSDMAISAGGQTLFELARIGVPTIGIQVVDNQVDNIDCLVKSGFLEFAGRFEDPEILQNIKDKIDYLSNYDTRTARNVLGRSLVDGYGSVRIASFLMGVCRFS